MDLVTYKDIAMIIRDLGFPIFVALYFMFRDYRRDGKVIEVLTAIAKGVKDDGKGEK